jgi:hypothetical protein
MLMLFAVEVQPYEGAPFNAQTKTFVGLPAVDKYQPGTVLDVRYDPQDPTQVSIEGRHDVPSSNPWLPDEQERKADEMTRQGDEMMRQANEALKKAQEMMQQADTQMQQANEEWQKADNKSRPPRR